YDANTGDGINDATVSGAGSAATTAGTPDDPAVADGFYTLYSPAGSQTFTAAKALYGDDSETATIAAGDTERVDFTLSSPVLVYAPDAFNVWLSANQQTVETLTLSNTGSAAMDWTLIKTGIPGGAFSNGPLVTHPGGGAGGADASALQGALGLTSYGTGHALSSGYRVADDFTLPAGGQIDTIVFYAYQTGSSTTSTINHVNLRIWRGRPGDPGSVVIWGDTTTNRMVSSVWSNIYRVLDTAMTGSTRPIMANTVNVGVLLPPGTYWLDWQTGGTLASGPWAPAISILGQTTTGNARQWDGDTLSWGDVLDGVYPQGFPFVLNGPADVAPWVSLSSASGSTAQGANTPVDFTFDSTGLTSGVYEAFVAITSTDPLRTVPPVVSMRLAVDANFASIQTGAWSGTAWASGSPTAGDWVTITTGHVVTVDSANAHCYNLHVEAGGTLVIPAGSSLTVERAVTNNGTLRQTRNVAASGSTRFLNLQNQAGTASAYYGVDITPSAGSGSTTVEVRGNQAACTQNGGAGDTALLKRCFEIDTPVTNATVRFWYIAPELNGQAPDALRLWHYDGANVWSEAGSGAYSYSGATCTGDDQCWVQRGGVSAFSPFTVGGPTAPTATTLRALVAQNGVYAVLGLALVAALGLVVLRRRKA
ncbi:MAG TPA: LPXTG cell wall anchor domain-containing protein, partial [Anaerolineae bacterium]|nr:LPXTG cell wall anchor domain-containing protein [Anaerolineae bacterium]